MTDKALSSRYFDLGRHSRTEGIVMNESFDWYAPPYRGLLGGLGALVIVSSRIADDGFGPVYVDMTW